MNLYAYASVKGGKYRNGMPYPPGSLLTWKGRVVVATDRELMQAWSTPRMRVVELAALPPLWMRLEDWIKENAEDMRIASMDPRMIPKIIEGQRREIV